MTAHTAPRGREPRKRGGVRVEISGGEVAGREGGEGTARIGWEGSRAEEKSGVGAMEWSGGRGGGDFGDIGTQ